MQVDIHKRLAIWKNQEARPAKAAGNTATAPAKTEVALPADTVEISEAGKTEASEPANAESAKKRNVSRMIRKGFLTAASTAMGLFNGLLSIPVGMQIGLDTANELSTKAAAEVDQADAPKAEAAPEAAPKAEAEAAEKTEKKSKFTAEDKKRLNAARVSTASSVVASSAAGMAVMGPVGLVLGGVMGYITGTVGNHLEARSGIGDHKMDRISESVEKVVGKSSGLWAKTKAVVAGGVRGATEGYKTRKTTSKIQLSGMLDGVSEAVKDWKATENHPHREFSDDDNGPLTKAAMAVAGGLFGTAGVMINAPGGAVIGTLESLKESSNYVPTQMEKNVMLWATNVGKFLPAAIVTTLASVAGPAVGVAAGTAVGVATASVTSIIDGRLGINGKIARPVKAAVKEAHGEEDVKENLRAYYRAGKGSVVGFSAGIREGWKGGFRGGVEVINDAWAATPESIDAKEEPKEAK